MENRGPPRIKNKAPAPVQISSEQLLREAVDRQEEKVVPTTTRFQDLEELADFQMRKRTEYENYIRRNRLSLKNWTQYSDFEIAQKDYRRARSVFERALDALPTNVQLWLRYIDSELKTRNVNHARNLLDRAVTLMPRESKLWYKYIFTEQTLGNVQGTKQIFERWMHWEPDEMAWHSYVNFLVRYEEFDEARGVYERFTIVHPEDRSWLSWVKFETEHGDSDGVREVFGMAIETLGDDFMSEKIFVAYARYEQQQKEYERARAIYKYALDRMPRSKSAKLHQNYTTFEKQFGDQEGVEDVVLAKRRVQYEEQLKESPKNYDVWLDLCRLTEAGGDIERIKDTYERAIAQKPPSTEKRHWRRYIYLWIFYAIWAEHDAQDPALAGQIYQKAMEIVPHSKHSHAKLWIAKAYYHIRQGDLTAARKTFGQALGRCPQDRLYREYIALEQRLFEFERCRTLHSKRVEWESSNCQAWIGFANLERGLGDLDRARAIFELAVDQPILDLPELLWKAYIDFETDEEEYDRARELYERLLQKTDHVKVWIAFAQFEINVPEDDEAEDEEEEQPISDAAKARARKIFERAHESFKNKDLRDDRVTLLNAWKSFEAAHGSSEDVEKVEKQMPRRVKKRRRLDLGNGETEFEEYLDWVFPQDDSAGNALSKLLQASQAWKKSQQQNETNEDEAA